MGTREEFASVVSDIGGRLEMEDEHVLEVESMDPPRVLGGVFDGHGGTLVARLARDRFPAIFRAHLAKGPEDAFRAAYAGIQKESRGMPGGAVAATFYLDGDRLAAANAGDAHVALVRGDRAERFTVDHRLTNEGEARRVVAAGATVWGPYVCLPGGAGIMPTRTLGDHAFGSVGVLSEPDIATRPVGPGLLVAACDGLWDVVGTEDLPRLLAGARTAADAAHALAHEALHVRSTADNLTIVVVRIP